MPAAYALTTVANYKAFAGITSSADDAAISTMIDEMSLALESRIGCQIIDRAVVEYAEGGAKTMYLQNPIVSVTSIVSPDTVTTIPSTDYWFQPRAQSMRHSSRWPHAFSTGGTRAKWVVSYVGGLFATTAPDDLILACNKGVNWLYEKRGASPDVSSVSVGAMSVSYGGGVGSASTFPSDVELLIAKYIRASIF